jgi:hypothetical protein
MEFNNLSGPDKQVSNDLWWPSMVLKETNFYFKNSLVCWLVALINVAILAQKVYPFAEMRIIYYKNTQNYVMIFYLSRFNSRF